MAAISSGERSSEYRSTGHGNGRLVIISQQADRAPRSLRDMREAFSDLDLEARAGAFQEQRQRLINLVSLRLGQRNRAEEFVCEVTDDRELDAEVDRVADVIVSGKLVEKVDARSSPPLIVEEPTPGRRHCSVCLRTSPCYTFGLVARFRGI